MLEGKRGAETSSVSHRHGVPTEAGWGRGIAYIGTVNVHPGVFWGRGRPVLYHWLRSLPHAGVLKERDNRSK